MWHHQHPEAPENFLAYCINLLEVFDAKLRTLADAISPRAAVQFFHHLFRFRKRGKSKRRFVGEVRVTDAGIALSIILLLEHLILLRSSPRPSHWLVVGSVARSEGCVSG
ncbi:hypothetical protein GCK32_004888 [Trichostrongylus colubriformis]|uniref:Uncharacterized protein n=1 Tax=Trichostrongylus colubriformis TaxID=6319 RepID=A0AAN8GAT3_TRICO